MSRARRRVARTARVAALAAPVAFVAVAAWSRRWVSDDGFIALRVVRMVTSGHGPVFNAGERVEAATSPLWVGVLAAADVASPVRLEWLAVVLGIAATVSGLALAVAGAARLWGGGSPVGRGRPDGAPGAAGTVVLPAGALAVAAYPPLWDYASAGLETGLVVAWIGACTWALAGWARGPDERVPAVTAALLGLGPVLRPDLAVVSATLVAAVLIGAPAGPGRRGAGERVRVLAVAAVPATALQLARMGWYAAVVPTPVLAKEGGRAWWAQGWRWLADGAGPYRLGVPAALGATLLVTLAARAGVPAQVRLVGGALWIAGFLWLAAIVRAGGDFMHGRLVVPALVLLAAPVAAVPVPTRGWEAGPGPGVAGAVMVAGLIGLIVWALAVATWARPPGPDPRRAVNDVRAFSVALTGRAHPVTLADWGAGPGGPWRWRSVPGVELYDGLRPARVRGRAVRSRPGLRTPTTVAYGVGVLAYGAGPEVRVFDALGLGDALTARFRLDGRGRRAGHEKVSPPAWTWARLVAPGETPDRRAFPLPAVLVADRAPTVARPADRRLGRARIAAVRAALSCGRLAELSRAVTDPMTPGRFLRNIGFAATTWAWRIPTDPDTAARECRFRRG